MTDFPEDKMKELIRLIRSPRPGPRPGNFEESRLRNVVNHSLRIETSKYELDNGMVTFTDRKDRMFNFYKRHVNQELNLILKGNYSIIQREESYEVTNGLIIQNVREYLEELTHPREEYKNPEIEVLSEKETYALRKLVSCTIELEDRIRDQSYPKERLEEGEIALGNRFYELAEKGLIMSFIKSKEVGLENKDFGCEILKGVNLTNIKNYIEGLSECIKPRGSLN